MDEIEELVTSTHMIVMSIWTLDSNGHIDQISIKTPAYLLSQYSLSSKTGSLCTDRLTYMLFQKIDECLLVLCAIVRYDHYYGLMACSCIPIVNISL